MAYVAYIDSTFYFDTYKGATINSTDFARIALRASDELDRITVNVVRLNGLASYSEDTQEAIKLATCALSESLNEINDTTGSITGGVGATSESVNGYSYSGGGDSESVSTALKSARKRAFTYLQRAGFTTAVYS